MTRFRLAVVVVGALAVGGLAALASRTYWEDVEVPMPLRGEAATNPFYAAERLTRELGASTGWSRTLTTVPASDSVIVLGAWHWDLGTGRQRMLERWVESGGRLVVDDQLAGGYDALEKWSGIIIRFTPDDSADADDRADTEPEETSDAPECRTFTPKPLPASSPRPYTLCGLGMLSSLVTSAQPLWALESGTDVQVMRVRVGRGSVTWINGSLFSGRDLLTADHARLFVDAMQLQRGDAVMFLSEDERPSLIALIWRTGAPVVVLALLLVALWLWRQGARFGPPLPAAVTARRSLAEQIRGTGRFIFERGGADALHLSTRRALDDVAGQQIQGYSRMSMDERAEALAALGHADASLVARALEPVSRHRQDLRRAIVVLESLRRRVSQENEGMSAWR